MNEVTVLDPVQHRNRNIILLIYVLYAAFFITGITALVAIIMNYVKRNDVRGTWLESHSRWQIRTFWWGLFWFVLGGMTSVVGIGWLILVVTAIWFIYRLVKGGLRAYENRPIEDA